MHANFRGLVFKDSLNSNPYSFKEFAKTKVNTLIIY